MIYKCFAVVHVIYCYWRQQWQSQTCSTPVRRHMDAVGSVAEVGAAAVGKGTGRCDVALTHGHAHALAEGRFWEMKQSKAITSRPNQIKCHSMDTHLISLNFQTLLVFMNVFLGIWFNCVRAMFLSWFILHFYAFTASLTFPNSELSQQHEGLTQGGSQNDSSTGIGKRWACLHAGWGAEGGPFSKAVVTPQGLSCKRNP